jgi:hypothetical protein
MRCLQYLGAVPVALVLLVAGCGQKGPTRLAIDRLRPEARWEGQRITVSGGRMERVHDGYALVIDPGQHAERVDLLCYFRESSRATAEKALRGQEVMVTGRVVGPFNMWTFPTMKLEDCELVLGNPPDTGGEKVLATRGRGQVDADRDIQAGKLKLRFRHGRRSDPPAWFPEYQRLLDQRCGVVCDVRPEAGPIAGLHPDDREYNEVMTVAIEKQHGVGILEKLRKQAESKPE